MRSIATALLMALGLSFPSSAEESPPPQQEETPPFTPPVPTARRAGAEIPLQDSRTDSDADPSLEARLSLWDDGGSGFWASARTGIWAHSEFEAMTAQGLRRIKKETLGEGAIDLGYRSDPWSFWLSFDYAQGDDVTLWVGGAHVGLSERLPFGDSLPLWGGVSAGVIAGQLDIDASDFGSFDTGVGFQARGELAMDPGIGARVSLWVDYRHIVFEYEESVLSGDDEAIGLSVAAGGALTFRF